MEASNLNVIIHTLHFSPILMKCVRICEFSLEIYRIPLIQRLPRDPAQHKFEDSKSNNPLSPNASLIFQRNIKHNSDDCIYLCIFHHRKLCTSCCF